MEDTYFPLPPSVHTGTGELWNSLHFVWNKFYKTYLFTSSLHKLRTQNSELFSCCSTTNNKLHYLLSAITPWLTQLTATQRQTNSSRQTRNTQQSHTKRVWAPKLVEELISEIEQNLRQFVYATTRPKTTPYPLYQRVLFQLWCGWKGRRRGEIKRIQFQFIAGLPRTGR